MGKFIKFHRAPYTVGLEVEDGRVLPVIRKGAVLPVESRHLFTTIFNYQFAAEIHVLKGEGRTVDENKTLARLLLPGITTGTGNSPRLEVILCADCNGFIEISIKDPLSGHELYTLLPDHTDKEMGRQTLTSRSLTRLKSRIINLVTYLTSLSTVMRAAIGPGLKDEIQHLLYDARVAIVRGDTPGLQSSEVFLETLINELFVLKNRREMKYAEA